MRPGKPYFLPWPWPVLLILAGLLAVVFLLFLSGVAGAAFARIGVYPLLGPMILLASLVGAGMNVPLWEMKGEPRSVPHRVRALGIPYRVPEVEGDRVVVAVNIGGCAIPIVMAGALLPRIQSSLAVVLATALVAAVCYLLARPVPGVGIAVFLLLPGAVAAVAALLLAAREEAAAVAWVAGTVGTLLGADILHLRDLRGVGATMASIGGAGTFAAIFVAGVTAALLA